MSTLPLADARARLSRLVDAASSTHERFEITRNGRRAAVLLGVDDYDGLLETLAVLADPDLLGANREGLAALTGGDHMDADELRALIVQADSAPG